MAQPAPGRSSVQSSSIPQERQSGLALEGKLFSIHPSHFEGWSKCGLQSLGLWVLGSCNICTSNKFPDAVGAGTSSENLCSNKPHRASNFGSPGAFLPTTLEQGRQPLPPRWPRSCISTWMPAWLGQGAVKLWNTSCGPPDTAVDHRATSGGTAGEKH